jgi:hypothetical protein
MQSLQFLVENKRLLYLAFALCPIICILCVTQTITPKTANSFFKKHMYKQLFFFFSVLALLSCTNSGPATNSNYSADSLNNKKQADQLSTKDSINVANEKINSQSSCEDNLIALLKVSSLNTDVKRLDFKINIEKIQNQVATIQLTVKNEERGDDMTITWIELDAKKMELRDITIDPDKPVKLKYEKALFETVVYSCKF